MTAVSDQITAGERRELRSVVRSQMKALRAEVKQRELELDAEIEKRLIEKYRDDDRRASDLETKIRKLTVKCNQQLQALVDEYNESCNNGARRRYSEYNTPHSWGRNEKRSELRDALQAGMKAEIRKAAVAVDRQEADLLRDLAVDGLRTESAQAFLETILSAKQLVPASKILEVEARYEGRF